MEQGQNKSCVLTRIRAIKDCKEIWKLVADGKARSKWKALDMLPELHEKYGILDHYSCCPLCAYTDMIGKFCDACPYMLQYGQDCLTYPSYDSNPVEFANRIMQLKEE